MTSRLRELTFLADKNQNEVMLERSKRQAWIGDCNAYVTRQQIVSSLQFGNLERLTFNHKLFQ